MRLDLYLCTYGFFDSRNKAQRAINDSRVSVNGKIITKTAYEVEENDSVEVSPSETLEFVGRGGNKLEHAFNNFNISANGKICLDIGASTGGFTQCLLMNGAEKVYAVDSGRDQLAEILKNDNRVVSIEGFNARALTINELDGNRPTMIVMDVSFISQKLLYPAIISVAGENCDIITLIKPQFEVGKQHLGKHGIVKDVKVRNKAVLDIIDHAKQMGFRYISHIESPITGGDGNIEFLLHLQLN